MKYLLVNENGQTNISQVVTKAAWSGSISEAARKLELSIVSSPTDIYLPKINIQCGNMLKMLDDSGVELFQGYIFSREKSLNDSDLSVVAFDGLVYLLKSKGSYNIKKMTAEAFTQKVCGELGIAIGSLAKTGIAQNHIFDGATIYEAIVEMYSNASKQNGKKYKLVMNQDKLSVIDVGSTIATTTLKYLSDAKHSESIENMINRVKVYNDKQKYIKTVENKDNIKKYGILQDIFVQEQGKTAESALKEIEQTSSIEDIGDTTCITGNAVKVNEPYTNITGLFWVSSDNHTFEDGQHKMSLELSYKQIYGGG